MYDRINKSDRFLGLGIVGVEELLANPSQRQIIPLQARPYEEDEVTGTLTVEVNYKAALSFVFSRCVEVSHACFRGHAIEQRSLINLKLSDDRIFNYFSFSLSRVRKCHKLATSLTR